MSAPHPQPQPQPSEPPANPSSQPPAYQPPVPDGIDQLIATLTPMAPQPAAPTTPSKEELEGEFNWRLNRLRHLKSLYEQVTEPEYEWLDELDNQIRAIDKAERKANRRGNRSGSSVRRSAP